jgi:hypothetical protein
MFVALSCCVGEIIEELLADVLPNTAGIGLACAAVQFSWDDICLGDCQQRLLRNWSS